MLLDHSGTWQYVCWLLNVSQRDLNGGFDLCVGTVIYFDFVICHNNEVVTL